MVPILAVVPDVASMSFIVPAAFTVLITTERKVPLPVATCCVTAPAIFTYEYSWALYMMVDKL